MRAPPFFAMFASGFRWCLAVLSPSPGGCRSGCVRAGPTEGSAAWALALKYKVLGLQDTI